MSLVVAEATEEGPRIVSDTRVIQPHGEPSSLKAGTLKAVVTEPDVAICFAGNVTVGLRAVRKFAAARRGGQPVEDLVPSLQELTANESVEFVVARGDQRDQLIRIRDGQVERGLPSAWIGDHQAFEHFQAVRNGPPTPFDRVIAGDLTPGAITMMRLRRAMEGVIADPDVETVGDFCAAITYRQNGFMYLGSTFIHVGRDFVVQAGEELTSQMAQSVGEGGYAVSVVEPAQPGTPALGLSFPRARLGMVYLPLQFDSAQVITETSARGFPKAVFERFGVVMKEPMLVEKRPKAPLSRD